MTVPARPKIFHIVHVDRLPSIIADGYLWCDAEISRRAPPGTTIGMSTIKQRRLELPLSSHPGLHVGECVPFYFCPRSVMLYMIYQANHPELNYRGGQGPIVHLMADLHDTVAWAEHNQQRWAFTLSNAGARYFEDRANLANLDDINWKAVQANTWSGEGIDPLLKEGKQAEFLIENRFPWHLIEGIGVLSQKVYQQVMGLLPRVGYRPLVKIKAEWYYG